MIRWAGITLGLGAASMPGWAVWSLVVAGGLLVASLALLGLWCTSVEFGLWRARRRVSRDAEAWLRDLEKL
jgi:hypothetical protein